MSGTGGENLPLVTPFTFSVGSFLDMEIDPDRDLYLSIDRYIEKWILLIWFQDL